MEKKRGFGTMGKMLKIIRWTLAIAFISVSVIGSIGGPGSDVNVNSMLNNPHGIAVDENGVIYCGINYSRINVYDKNGNFLRSMSIDSNGGDFKIVPKKKRLLVQTVRNQMLYEYDSNGNLIKQEKRQDDDKGFQQLSVDQFVDNEGTVYEIKNSFLFYPYIEKTTQDGEKTKLTYVPFSKWIFMEPYPSWHFGFIGIILIALDLKFVKKTLRFNGSRT